MKQEKQISLEPSATFRLYLTLFKLNFKNLQHFEHFVLTNGFNLNN